MEDKKMTTVKKLTALLLTVLMLLSSVGLLAVVSTAAEAEEKENNNIYTTANALAAGTIMKGKLETSADVDWFSFTTSSAVKAKITFAHAAQSGTNDLFYVYVFDKAGASTSSGSVAKITSKASETSSSVDVDCAANQTYYIKVYTANSAAAGLQYTIVSTVGTSSGTGTGTGTGSESSTDTPATAEAETEDNNTYQYADVITTGKPLKGKLSAEDDVDFFYVQVDECQLSYEISHAANAEILNTVFKVQFFDSELNEISPLSTVLEGSKSTASVAKYSLDAGKYYIKVFKGAVYDPGDYSIVVDVAAALNYTTEEENNNTLETANKIKLGKEMRGRIDYTYEGTEDTRDYYTFTSTGEGLLSLSFSHAVTESSAVIFRVKVLDKDETLVASVDSKANDATVTFPKDILAAGKYYILVTIGDLASKVDYSFTADFINKQGTEKEPDNDVYSGALVMETGNKDNEPVYLGKIGSSTDVDFFKFVLPARGYAYINFYNMNTSSTIKYKVEVCKLSDGAGEVTVTPVHTFTVNKSIETYKSAAIGLDAGQYYIKVSAAEYAPNGTYGVGMQAAKGDYFEIEPNNSRNTATPVKDGGNYIGASFDMNDEDWFVLETKADKKYTITFAKNSATSEEATAKWNVYAFEGDKETECNQISFTNKKGTSEEIVFKTKEDGTYYFRVTASNAQYAQDEYVMLISSKEDNNKDVLTRFATLFKNLGAAFKNFFANNMGFMKTFDWSQIMPLLKRALQSLGTIIKTVTNRA